MLMNTQPEALRLADRLNFYALEQPLQSVIDDTIIELRRLHEVNQELVEPSEGMIDAHAIPSSICKDRPAYEKAQAALAKAKG